MATNEKSQLTMNRIVAFLAGAVLVFLVMNFSVVSTAKAKVADIQQQFDAVRYDAARLLTEAKALAKDKDNKKAEETLATLFAQQPGSAEAAEGRILNETLLAADKRQNERWAIAEVGIRQKWAAEEGIKLRDQFNKGLADNLSSEWDKVKDQMRMDWEKI